MDLQPYLEENRRKLVERWIDAVITTYPPDSVGFFKNTRDKFANPVGSTIKRSIDLLFTEVIKEKMDMAAVQEAMDPIVRLRAVQEFSPSQALSFLFSIKPILQKSLEKNLSDPAVDRFLRDVAVHTDELMLTAIDIYSKCRETVFLLRINQAKESVKKLLIKNNLICEIPDALPVHKPENETCAPKMGRS
ncbi:MAG: hypothetical protein COX19_16830 [Desulfobacterales bacterium CG23_combo_of_CG06-09_8_20_14_all_51_8]|nr:MAG: hypothetical protein COX19_16830 [Desulfobacterales bacterium CG23_combo_of_CG06-09_8_20_14_all_51_8]